MFHFFSFPNKIKVKQWKWNLLFHFCFSLCHKSNTSNMIFEWIHNLRLKKFTLWFFPLNFIVEKPKTILFYNEKIIRNCNRESFFHKKNDLYCEVLFFKLKFFEGFTNTFLTKKKIYRNDGFIILTLLVGISNRVLCLLLLLSYITDL